MRHRRLSVLVVEDNVDLAESLAEFLTLYGYETRIARSGEEAVELAAGRPADVVVLDINLPGDDGFTTARKLREQWHTEPLLVAVTGYDHHEERSIAEGFAHHFVKPADPFVLAELIHAHEQMEL